MKPAPFLITILLICNMAATSQITAPVVRANFGVDGDLRANFFNGASQGSGDDWFRQAGAGTGQFVIDTTGSAAILARYATDMAFRRLPFFRTMRYPGFTVVNSRLLLDAVFIRDYHGDDSTVFASGANKNGDSPVDWSCPVSQGIPDKNDILDMMVHVRRAGPNSTDSLWMMGGLSLDNTTGNRYFDFEMYQTDIYYDRGTQSFYGYGPDAGHTSWKFDASGNITTPGDIIFSAEYQSSSLSFVEARIWIDRAALLTTPVAFDWSGQFDGDVNSSQYGYASIQPKSSGAYYTGLQCSNNTWGGPFGIILQDESLVANYTARQFVEFSVNLTKLGLDPVTLLGGGGTCGMPFRRILVKTRASASFTSELKDFLGPFDFFLAPRADILTESPLICNGSVAEIHVTNAVATSTYEWSTPNGNIVSGTTGPSINVNMPGTYIVNQYLQAGCSLYASDTITILPFNLCELLAASVFDLRGRISNGQTQLNWKVSNNQQAAYFEIERSTDGNHFTTIGHVEKNNSQASIVSNQFIDDNHLPGGTVLYYRVKLVSTDHTFKYSNTIALSRTLANGEINIYPNPVYDVLQVQIGVRVSSTVDIGIYDAYGKKIKQFNTIVSPGSSVISLDEMANQPRGLYLVSITAGGQTVTKKIIVAR